MHVAVQLMSYALLGNFEIVFSSEREQYWHHNNSILSENYYCSVCVCVLWVFYGCYVGGIMCVLYVLFQFSICHI